MARTAAVRAECPEWWSRPGAMLWLLLFAALPVPVLAQTGTVSGTVTNATTSAPVTTGSVVLCDATTCTSASLNASGGYSATLSAGSYVAYTNTNAGVANEIYDNIACPALCDSTAARNLGTPIVVPAGGAVTGRNFALSPSATLSGTVTDAAGAPIANVGVQVMTRFDNRNVFVGSTTTNASGVYAVAGLGAGEFYAYTFWQTGASSHTNEIFGDILCPGSCSSATAVGSGTPIPVAAGATAGGNNFALSAGGTLTGTVANAVSAAPLPGVNVSIYGRIGSSLSFFRSANTNASGVYTVTGLPTGAYYVVTSTSAAINEVSSNRACEAACTTAEIAAGDPVAVTGGATSTASFSLDPGGSISGVLTEVGTGAPVIGSVSIYRPSGSSVAFVGSVSTNASGAYTVSGLSTGSYFVLAAGIGYIQEVYSGIHCFPCFTSTIATGTAIAVTLNANTPNINVVMDRSGTISGTLTNAATGGVIASASVRLFLSTTSTTSVSTNTNSAGQYSFTGLTAGTYYVATAAPSLVNQVYNGVVCPNGSCSQAFAVANGSAVPVGAGATVTNINFSLGVIPTSGLPGAPTDLQATNTPSGVVFTWRASTSGGAPTSYILEAGLTSGTTFTTLAAGTNSLTVPGVPPGTYYIRVRGVNASGTGPASSELTLRVAASGAILPGVPTNFQAWMSGQRLTVTWTAPVGATPIGYQIEVGSAAGLSNVATLPVTARSFTYEPVPPGFYFLRVRAVVTGASGLPTTDVMINSGNVPAPPSEPSSFSATGSNGTVTLTWAAPLFGPAATSYVVEAGTATGLSNITVFNTGGSGTTLVVPGVPPGTYYVRIRAVNALGVSPPSFERVLTMS